MWISEQTATFALYSIDWLVFITVVKSVYCAVRADSLHKTDYVSSLKRLNKMENKHLSEVALQCQSRGKRQVRRPRIRRSEQDHLKANELRRTGRTAIKLQRS